MKCVIFDLDGTLLYTLEDLFNAVNYTLEHFGYKKRTLEEGEKIITVLQLNPANIFLA